jgi:hypothetical protein
MKYFKDDKNNVYAYEDDGSQDEFIRPEFIPISEDEAKKLTNPGYSHEQLVAFAVAKKSEMFAQATYEISWRQDAVDTGKSTTEIESQLYGWKEYRFKLHAVDTSNPQNINWPAPPVV